MSAEYKKQASLAVNVEGVSKNTGYKIKKHLVFDTGGRRKNTDLKLRKEKMVCALQKYFF